MSNRPQPTMDEAIKGFIKLRDQKQELQKEHKEELRPINDKLEIVGGWIQRELQKRGIDSAKTSEGTAFLQKNSTASVKDRDAFFEFVISHERWDLLENRCSKSAVEDHLENTGEVVPGVNYQKTQVVRVRR